jgi:hypothetical protein
VYEKAVEKAEKGNSRLGFERIFYKIGNHNNDNKTQPYKLLVMKLSIEKMHMCEKQEH